jgi:hypothetical protein
MGQRGWLDIKVKEFVTDNLSTAAPNFAQGLVRLHPPFYNGPVL